MHTREVALADAQKINGLRAVFGEVYPDPVRVVSVGPTIDDLFSDPSNVEWAKRSIEFCGGTHLKAPQKQKILPSSKKSARRKVFDVSLR